MRYGSDILKGVLTGSFNHRYLVDLYYDGERRLADVPVTSISFSEDGNAKIQQSGSLTIVWTDEFGTSISPKEIGDILAPFGAEIYLYSIVESGPFQERIPLGQFTITNVPSAQDEEMLFRGQWIAIGSTVKIEFKERLAKVQDDRFDVPTAATNLVSVWDEVGRLTELPLLRRVPDKPISRSVVYQEDRLDAVYDLFDILDAVPHMTADGALAARPNEWPSVIDTLKRGDNGTIISVGRSMSPEQVYNRVAFRGKAGDASIILAAAEVKGGPLRARNSDGTPSPFRRKTYFLSSEYITNVADAFEYVNRELPRVSQLRSVIIPVEETYNPLRERGDVINLQRVNETLTGRIISINRSRKDVQSMNVEVLN